VSNAFRPAGTVSARDPADTESGPCPTTARVDAYIARQADFARPILEHLRRVVHAACPEVEETMKWSMPHFTYKGQMLAGMAAFKAHATFGLLAGERGSRRDGIRARRDGPVRPADLGRGPAARGRAQGHDPPRRWPRPSRGPRPGRRSRPGPSSRCPPTSRSALDGNPAARASYDDFPPSAKRDYLEWLIEAKRPETREKAGPGGGMDGRRQEAALEISGLLSAEGAAFHDFGG
jgi:hypothetical protein